MAAEHNPETQTNGVGRPLPAGDNLPVIISGAGPAGLLLSILLARKNIRSVVFEQNETLDTSPRGALHYPPVLEVFKEAGVYDAIMEHAYPMGGNYWRKPIVDDGKGNKVLGPVVARLQTAQKGEDGKFEEGKFCIIFAQGELVKLLYEETQKLDLIDVHLNSRISDFKQDSDGVTVTVIQAGETKTFRSQYLVGCDGGKSTVRKLLGLSFSGHAWPEKLLATDVRRTVSKLEDLPPYFVVDKVHWGVVTPLERITPGEPGLWRFAMAVPDPSLTEEQIEDPEYVNNLLLKYIDGPRPSNHTVVRRRAYRVQQLLVSTMHRGRVALAGDAAHLNNPIGGLGLCSGLLDVDLLFHSLDLILNHDYHDPQDLLAEYSAARRFVFSSLINPMSTSNKLRLHDAEPDLAAREDWLFRALSRNDPKQLAKIFGPLGQLWRTDIRTITREKDTST